VQNFLIRVVTAVVAGSLFLTAYFFSKILFISILLVGLIFILLFEWPLLCKKNKKLWFLTPVYPVFPFFCIVWSVYAFYKSSIFITLYPFFVSWAADTGGYIFGNLWGKHKIWPSISPKKTWEGLIGSFVTVTFFNLFALKSYQKFYLAVPIASLIFTLAAFFGDLFESFLKRRASLKDSGTILPGHGGILDRVDSVLFAAVVYFLLFYV
jgi:phosphatidate cytidylyltransferase